MKTTIASAIYYFDKILLLHGVGFYPGQFRSSVNLIIRILLVAIVFIEIRTEVLNPDPSLIGHITWLTFYVFASFYTFTLWKNFPALKELFGKVFKNISKNASLVKELDKSSKLALALYTILTILCGIFAVSFFTRIGDSEKVVNSYLGIPGNEVKLHHIVLIAFLFPFSTVLVGFEVPGVLTHTFFLNCLLLNEKKLFADLKIELSRDIIDMNVYKKSLLKRIEQKELVIAFEKTLSYIPFLVFVYNFLSANAYIVIIRNQYSGFLSSLVMLSQHILNVVYGFSSLFFTEHVNSKIVSMATEARVAIIKSQTPDCLYKLLLVQDLERNCDLRLTAWGMFYLNKPFIISYIGGIVTFSVLILGLET